MNVPSLQEGDACARARLDVRACDTAVGVFDAAAGITLEIDVTNHPRPCNGALLRPRPGQAENGEPPRPGHSISRWHDPCSWSFKPVSGPMRTRSTPVQIAVAEFTFVLSSRRRYEEEANAWM